ncbi:hypothetical protein C0995_002284 [Termitomyces sp. Mi166|nr:hypothetical protein C0995_002284 [Termitomyces sp. Mi166\
MSFEYDVHLCAYSGLVQMMAKFYDEISSESSSPDGLNKPKTNAYQGGVGQGIHVYFNKCIDHAKSVIQIAIENLAATVYMRYAPDAFLLKLLKPEFASHITVEQETEILSPEILSLVRRLVETLSSPGIAVNDRHTPKLYARFLASLLSRHMRDQATVECLRPHTLSNDNYSYGDFAHGSGIPSISTFPNTSLQTAGGGNIQGSNSHGNIVFQHDAETGIADTGAVWGDMSSKEMFATMEQLENLAWGKNMMPPG